MIPCYICGKDASTGWTKGFVPAPDSQKLALCPEHNTPENRLAVVKAWRALIEREAAIMTGIAGFRAAAPSLQTATVHFTGGGMLSFTCLSCSPTTQGTLCIESPDGARNFIPMQHIREYSVRPYASDTAETGPGEPAHTAQIAFPPSSLHPSATEAPPQEREPVSSFHSRALPEPAPFQAAPESGQPGASVPHPPVAEADDATPPDHAEPEEYLPVPLDADS